MLIQRDYLSQLIAAKDLKLIKVITGVRRCGKSTLLAQYRDYLMSVGVQERHIIYMNFESAAWYDIKDYRDLYQVLAAQMKGKSKKYLLLDEVQNVQSWEKAVNSLAVDCNCDIYLTGSNAYLLSGELSTLLAGRVLTIKVFPFSYREFGVATGGKVGDNQRQSFQTYLTYGGMPMISEILDKPTVLVNYLGDVREVVMKKDIIARNQIKDVVFLDNLTRYLAANIGNLISANTIANYMKGTGSSISRETIAAYLQMLEQAYLIYRVPRYELKSKQLLKTQGKYYFVDTGIKNSVAGFASFDSGASLENVVLLELLRRGFEVYVGQYQDWEVDFVAIKPTQRLYLQVARSLADRQVWEREKRSLLAVRDNYRKLILTLDEVMAQEQDGVEVVNVIDWLMADEKFCDYTRKS